MSSYHIFNDENTDNNPLFPWYLDEDEINRVYEHERTNEDGVRPSVEQTF